METLTEQPKRIKSNTILFEKYRPKSFDGVLGQDKAIEAGDMLE